MEDSRKGKGDEEKGLWMPNPHVDGEKGKGAIVYKMKEGERKGDWKYSKTIALGHVRGYFLCLYGCITLSFKRGNPISWS